MHIIVSFSRIPHIATDDIQPCDGDNGGVDGLWRNEASGGQQEDSLTDGMAPTTKRLKLARSDGLKKSLDTGAYPLFHGVSGVVDQLDPLVHNSLDFVKLLWPDSLCEHIADQTNLYAKQQGADKWCETTCDEIWVFYGIIIHMGICRLPSIECYWSTDTLLGVEPIRQAMSLNRFKGLWRYLHCDDNKRVTDPRDITCKLKTVISTLGETFVSRYNPGQELSVDEMMVKYKGRKGGKIRMPKKPIKLGFKIWCCSCSCCGYLLSFNVYNGRPVDATGRKVTEKGLVKKVVLGLLIDSFDCSGVNHVVYMDNYFTSGPLIQSLAEHNIYVVGTITQHAAGFPAALKGVKPPKGSYESKTVDCISYFVFHDRKIVCFATNAFPETMPDLCFRLQPNGTLCSQSVPPCLFPYNLYMGGVDTTNHLVKTYGYDRKSRRYWFRLKFQMLDLAINNGYLLYKNNCKRVGVTPMTTLQFRLDISRALLCVSQRKFGCSSRSGVSVGISPVSSAVTCVNVDKVGLKRGRCHICVKERVPCEEQKHTNQACPSCAIRLCKTHSTTHIH